MINNAFQKSIWSTIRFALTEVGDDDISTREEITSILVDSLSGIGVLEMEYTYTGVATESNFPEAFVFDEDGKTMRAVLVVGRPSNGPIPKVKNDQVVESIVGLIKNIETTYVSNENFNDTGANGVGEFVYLLRDQSRSISTFDLTVIVLGNCDDPDELIGLPEEMNFGGRPCHVKTDVYDINKVQKTLDENSDSGSVSIDFREFIGGPLKCLQAPTRDAGFDTYLAIIPGEVLASIYERYRTRILQKNLRNYLQASGKVNKGIQKSLKEMPEKFLAFNNGLTVTASAAQINENGYIEILSDFQIVNGGQTTASLDHARRLSGLDLKSVSIQAKIVVIDIELDHTFIDDVSNYANSQNKVKMSDFSSRDSFHVALSSLMRDNENLVCEWDDGSRNYWFYEAFRGGYKTELGELTGKRRRRFERNFPKSQVIDKLELAKCENSWDGFPHFVCRHGDMNFAAWVKRTKPQSRNAPNLEYCKEIIAKVILWRSCERLVKEQNFSGFASLIVAMSFSYLVFLLEIQNLEIDLQNIWDRGSVPDEIEEELLRIIFFVKDFLPAMSELDNPAQWARKPECWEKLKGMKNDTASRSVSRLLKQGLLREKGISYDVLCTRAIDLLEKTNSGMNKSEFLFHLNIDASQWERFRRELLAGGDVNQIGTGANTKYVIG